MSAIGIAGTHIAGVVAVAGDRWDSRDEETRGGRKDISIKAAPPGERGKT